MKRIKLKINIMIPFVSILANAGTDLPYIGPEMAENCKVIESQNFETDGGYLTNEDCSIIYVKPPKIGNLDISAWAINSRAQTCDGYNSLILGIKEAEIQMAKADDASQLRALKQKITYLKEIVDKENNSGAALVANVVYNLRWQELVTEYAIKNPDKNVRYLPISFSTISVSTINPNDELSILSNATSGLPSFLQLNALKIDPSQNSNLPDFIKNSTCESGQSCSTNYLMGQSAGGMIGLNLAQTCPLWNQKNSNIDEKGLSAYLSSTYSYFYYIQTKSFFSVSLNKDKILSSLSEALKKKDQGDVTVPDLMKIMEGKETITITVNPGYSTTNPITIDDARKEELKKYVLDAFLISATDQLQRAIESSKETQTTSHSRQNCIKVFGIKIKCSTTVYHINITSINWNKVINKMKELGISTTNSASDETYSNIIMFDTSAFKFIRPTLN